MSYSYAIVGGGLAGLTLAHTLLIEHEVAADRIVLFESESKQRGSDAPGALLHPFPSRSLTPHPRAMEGYRASIRLLEHWDDILGEDVLETMPMVRPIFDDSVGARLLETWHDAEGSYPDWLEIQHVEGSTLESTHPHLAEVEEAIVYEPAFSVDLERVRHRWIEWLEARGVDLRYPEPVRGLASDREMWRLEAETSARAERVALACPHQLQTWWPDLDLRGTGGELLMVSPPTSSTLECAVNASGHVAPHVDASWVIGSTWWEPDTFDTRTTHEAADALLERGRRLVPALDEADVQSIWRGVRVKYRDHWPLVGPIPGFEGLSMMTGFGSKGLFRVPLFAKRLAEWWVEGRDAIDERAHTLRVDLSEWAPDDTYVQTT